MGKTRARAAWAWLALGLVACSTPAPITDAGADTALPDARPDVGTRDAGPDAGDVLGGFTLSAWTTCPGSTLPATTVDCATFTVPLDWSRPGGTTLTRPVRRYRAQGARIGVLVWNPGGPGATTYPIADPLTGSDPATAMRFDRISIDWRGVGTSNPALRCPRPVGLDVLRNVTASGTLPGAATESLRYGHEAMTDCLASIDPTLAQHAGTVDMARDLEALRIALGEDQLNYVGFSYGTGLGALYASMYPDRVRAFVLDSPLTPRTDAVAFGSEQLASQEAGLHAFFDWCAANGARCPFASGRDAAGLAAALTAIDQELAVRPRLVTGAMGAEGVADASGFLAYVVGTLINPGSWPRLGAELARAEMGDLSGYAAVVVPNATTWDASFPIIFALDRPFAPWITESYAVELSRRAIADDPLLGPTYVAGTGPLFGVPRGPEPFPALGAASAPPLLILSNRGDMQTPYLWGPEMRDALGNGSHFVTYDGLGHARSPDVPCLRAIAVAFLVDPTTPPATTTCAAVAP